MIELMTEVDALQSCEDWSGPLRFAMPCAWRTEEQINASMKLR